MSVDTLIVSATRKLSSQGTKLCKSLAKHNLQGCDVEFVLNNKKGLCSVYNSFLKNTDYSTIIFVHDDVHIDSVDFVDTVKVGLQTHSVVGVAGGSEIKKTPPALWHLLTKKETQSGIVHHPHHENGDYYFPTVFGPVPKQVSILDGVFLAVNTNDLLSNDILFDENIKGFHHYDIKLCIDCKLAGLSLSTLPITIMHDSPGISNFDESYYESEKYILDFLKSV